MNSLFTVLITCFHISQKHINVFKALHKFIFGLLFLCARNTSNLFVDGRLHLMELRSRLSIIGYWPFIRNHSAHHLLCVLYPSVDLMLAIEISMLMDIL